MEKVVPVCDHKSVGILVWDSDGKLLLIERKKIPFGFALPAGHVDEHGSFEEAAKKELEEEVGLVVLRLHLEFEGRQENPCRRGAEWHDWKVYQAKVTGDLKPSPEETKQANWYTEEEVYALADKTKKYLAGKITEQEWEDNPGLEPVWLDILKKIDVLYYPPESS